MKGIVPILGVLFSGALAHRQSAIQPAPLFAPEERQAIQQFWNAPGRYKLAPASNPSGAGPWQVRLTPDGSIWLWNYNKARGISKTPPTQTPPPQNEEQQAWEAWIDAKVARDRWEAARNAADLNAATTDKPADFNRFSNPEPPIPGPIPMGLLLLAGDPPPMAVAVIPISYTITFDDDKKITLTDHPPMAPRYAYYRFPQGVMLAGKKVKDLPSAELDKLYKAAGVSASERKAMAAVSSLEGGFEAVNTYDTGFVSIGFIQFACLQGGAGSLGQLLLRYKADKPESFNRDFHKFGIDVVSDGQLAVVDPNTGAEVTGQSAGRKIIEDKRLVAVFQRAGAVSEDFRVAQIATAKAQYLPSDDPVTIQIGSKTLSGKVSDVVKSEAGLATLMDMKVNTGSLGLFLDVLAVCAEECNADSLKDLAKYERDICRAMRYRRDFLADASLSQPGPSVNAERDYKTLASRRASRIGRKGG